MSPSRAVSSVSDPQDVVPHSYADAVEDDAVEQDPIDAQDIVLDESAIKETPPRPVHSRNGSGEPRPFGEVLDEALPSPGSPTLRHPKGRLEAKKKERSAYSLSSSSPSSSPLPNGDGHGAPVREIVRNGLITNTTTHTFDGVGEVEPPQSPTRRAHKRVSSRSLHADANRPTSAGSQKDHHLQKENSLQEESHSQQERKSQGESYSQEESTPQKESHSQTESSPQQDMTGTSKSKGPNGTASKETPPKDTPSRDTPSRNAPLTPESPPMDLIRNKSGENLASIRQNENDFLSLQQMEDKPSAARQAQRERGDSELTSGRRAGEGWARSAVRWAPLNVPVQRRLQTAMVLMHTLSIVGGLTIFLVLCGIPLLWPILVPYLVYVLFSQVSVDGSLAQRSEFWRRSKIWSLFASYFPARLHRSQELEPNRKYVFGYHPHGIISHGGFAAFATEALGFSQLFPGITNTLLTLDSNFRIPLYREYALRMGLASVSRESCENILSKGGPNKEGMGRAITIVVGGARESLDAKPYTLRLVLRRRKGFVKLAIRCGADLVPVLAFGENDIYDQFDSESHPWIHKGQMLIKKVMGFTIPLFHARGVFNYDVGMMPYRRPINIVVGKPIRTIQNKTPDAAYVDELHAKYVAELQRIWDEWKDTFARERRGEMEIVE